MPDPLDAGPVLLYDGLCGFCDRAVQFVLRHDHRGTMRFAALQGEFAREVIARHPELAGVDSVILVERAPGGGERVSARSEAALGVARYLGGLWRSAAVLRAVPRAMRDWAYDSFARHRYRWFKRLDACRVPAPDERARFLGDHSSLGVPPVRAT